MTPADLRRFGEALYGPEWQTPMAGALGVADRTVRRWLAGTSQIPDGLRADLLALLPARLTEARDRVQTLRQIERQLSRAA